MDRKLQLVSLQDIGRFNAVVIEHGPELAGRRFNYAGDELTRNEMTVVLAETTGRELEYEEQPMDEVRAMAEDLALMYQWFDRVGYSADVAGASPRLPRGGLDVFRGLGEGPGLASDPVLVLSP